MFTGKYFWNIKRTKIKRISNILYLLIYKLARKWCQITTNLLLYYARLSFFYANVYPYMPKPDCLSATHFELYLRLEISWVPSCTQWCNWHSGNSISNVLFLLKGTKMFLEDIYNLYLAPKEAQPPSGKDVR